MIWILFYQHHLSTKKQNNYIRKILSKMRALFFLSGIHSGHRKSRTKIFNLIKFLFLSVCVCHFDSFIYPIADVVILIERHTHTHTHICSRCSNQINHMQYVKEERKKERHIWLHVHEIYSFIGWSSDPFTIKWLLMKK